MLGLAMACKQEERKEPPKKPNIIFIFSDDHAYQAIGAYGGKLMPTPNIDRIASQGAIFNNVFVTNSICGPSRATLLTGKFSHLNGYKANEEKFDVSQQLFTRLLGQSGYQTAWVGKWHLGTAPGDAVDYWTILPGQGHYYNPDFITAKDTVQREGYVTDLISDYAVDFLEKRDTAKPFFMVVGEKATHRQWLPDIQDLGAFDSIDFPLPETFYDDYKGRFAAGDQDMTIDKTMRLKEDLKIHEEYAPDEKSIAARREALIKSNYAGKKLTPEQEKQIDRFLRRGTYQRFSDKQREAFFGYYDRISKEFDEKKLSGKALVEWKYQRYLKDYLSTARSLDRNIGRLLDYLDQNGLAENTIVVYASDQGFYLGEHGWFDKRFIYEESLRTPMVMRYPGVIEPGTKINEFVLNVDWAPTFLDIAGVSIPSDIQGRSILPLLSSNGSATPWRDAAYYHYYEFPQPHHVHPHFGVRTAKYKLVRFYGEKNFWELYDLEKDPKEINNIYDEHSSSPAVTELKSKLQQLIKEYDDKEAAAILAAEN
ncbi:sulfatase [Chryseolinea sp. T2]|uniref:sulfatase family protein n=1 Tax=Chryseolinea sp. T2 TaxID=3129255 RepID=UPI00307729AA